MPQILNDDGWNHIPCTKATSSDIAVFGEGNDTQHSGKVESVKTVASQPSIPNISLYKFDESQSILSSKWGNTQNGPQSDSFSVNYNEYRKKYKCYSRQESDPNPCDAPGDNEIWKSDWLQ